MGMSGDDTKFEGPEEFNPATLVLFIVESERRTDEGAWQLARYCQEHKVEIVKWLSRDPNAFTEGLRTGVKKERFRAIELVMDLHKAVPTGLLIPFIEKLANAPELPSLDPNVPAEGKAWAKGVMQVMKDEGSLSVGLTPDEFDAMPEYSCSLPSGTIPGKRWRCNRTAYALPRGQKPDWWMGTYIDIEDPSRMGIQWRRIMVNGSPP